MKGSITFLGTAGARVMVAKQILASGGIWADFEGVQILIDPGPGTLVQAARKKLQPEKLSAIILTHKHLDHSSDVNVMIEAMTEGGLKRRGAVFAPADALEEDPVILRYLRSFPERIEVLREGGSYTIEGISFRTPVRHIHPVETYGLLFELPEMKIAFIADSRFFPELPSFYPADIIIINVVRAEPGGPFDHLSIPDAERIISEIKPKLSILTHFGMTMWRAKPAEVARRLSEKLGLEVMAARDGLTLDLGKIKLK